MKILKWGKIECKKSVIINNLFLKLRGKIEKYNYRS